MRTTEHEGVPVVVLSGDLDIATAPKVRDTVVKLATAGHLLAVIDLREVEFLDSTGLGVLVGCLKRFRTLGGDLRLVVTSDRVRKVFEITGLDRAFTLHEGLDEAVAAA
jgi:anti-sigma B factor antagonist